MKNKEAFHRCTKDCTVKQKRALNVHRMLTHAYYLCPTENEEANNLLLKLRWGPLRELPEWPVNSNELIDIADAVTAAYFSSWHKQRCEMGN